MHPALPALASWLASTHIWPSVVLLHYTDNLWGKCTTYQTEQICAWTLSMSHMRKTLKTQRQIYNTGCLFLVYFLYSLHNYKNVRAFGYHSCFSFRWCVRWWVFCFSVCIKCILLVLFKSVDCYGKNKAGALITAQQYNIVMGPSSKNCFDRKLYITITGLQALCLITLLLVHCCCLNMNVKEVIFGEPTPPSAPSGVR